MVTNVHASLAERMRELWRRAVPMRLRQALGRIAGPAYTRIVLARPPRQWSGRFSADGPIVVTSFFDASSGIGAAGRLTAAALERAGFRVIRHDIRLAIGPDASGTLPGDPRGVWILCCNAPEARAVMARIARREWLGRRRIGYWNWELQTPPKEWRGTARLFDELWLPSAFTAAAFTGWGVPTRVVPLPVAATGASPDHARFGLDAGRVNILAMADLDSTAARKNPLGALDAFLRTFPQNQSLAVLLLKVSARESDPAAFEQLSARAAGRSDIVLLRERLSDGDMAALMQTADLFVSLHRAEGFGLGIAEAMAAGKPVLVTGWSANVEFMSGLEAAMVAYDLVPIPPNTPVYGKRDAVWAEPDLGHAATRLKALVEHSLERRRLGEAGREAVSEHLAPLWSRGAILKRLSGGNAV